jgi:CRISPR-associated protein Csb1
MTVTFEILRAVVANDAAVRRVQKLQPVGGAGDKIFPPTYPGERTRDPPRHVFEMRRFGDKNVLCVLIDSVQSQANRLEEALKIARSNGLAFPVIAVDFSDTEVADIGPITTLDAPHRVFDAIIRDSELRGMHFKDTDEGKRLVESKPQNARAIYEVSPTALVFGAWNSTQVGGGLGAKFPRSLVSEIIGVGVATESHIDARTGEISDRPSGQRASSRIDPLGIVSAVRVFKKQGASNEWTVDEEKAEKKNDEPILFAGRKRTGMAGRPALINHGNIKPSVDQLGVSIDYAQHVFVISFAALRRLRFSDDLGADLAAQTTLAALGLAAVTAQDRNGYCLRSRCDLVPEAKDQSNFEIVRADGQTEPIDLDFDIACRVVKEAAEAAKSAGIPWNAKDLLLKPHEELIRMVRESRKLALQGEAEDGDEEEE